MLKLDNNYIIDSDAFNVILRFESIGDINEKTGKPTISSSETYHASLEQAVSSYVNQRLKTMISKESHDITSLISGIQSMKEDILKEVQAVNKVSK